MKERNIHFPRQQFTSAVDKATRAQAFRGRLSQGRVYFPKYASWLSAFETELLTFPAGKHDDQVDAMSLFGRLLDQMFPPVENSKAVEAGLAKLRKYAR
jgi:predicted phage terminase large subunit-like protein